MNDISTHVMGAKGVASFAARAPVIQTDTRWTYTGERNNQSQTEHDELFASIRKGTPINNGEYMSKSTLLAIMGRMTTYTGQTITWEQALNSQEDLSPESYDWNAKPPASPVAMPGLTQLV
jgi:hypothetical protein